MDVKPSSEKRLALLIDADNVSYKYISAVLDELSKYGIVTYKRIYGDWTNPQHAKWKDKLLQNSILPMQQYSYTQGKNSTDSALIIDAMDILYTNSVDGFCLVSSDSDFTRLAARIRESGLTVIGMGEKKTPLPFRTACDIFTTLEVLIQGTEPKGRPPKSRGANEERSADEPTLSREKIEMTVTSIINDNLAQDKPTTLSDVGNRLLKRYPDFDVRNYGTNQLKKLLSDFPSLSIETKGSIAIVSLVEPKPSAKRRPNRRSAKPTGEPEAAAPASPDQGAEAAPKPDAALAGQADGATPQAEKDPAAARFSDEDKPTPGRAFRNRRRVGSSKEQDRAASDQPKREETQREDAKRAAASAVEAEAKTETAKRSAPADMEAIRAYVAAEVDRAGERGVAMPTLGKRLRAQFEGFDHKAFGYPKLIDFLAQLDGIAVDRRERSSYAIAERFAPEN
ncbi:hypothetical protein JI75_02810 [Berryella intestinalis]|uniref:HTH OST-type domain-containing protein n=2 Tax=Eggerthellaceae TaxID=1643826 RepID=A0A0A8B2X1_9ACTN|nr:NYN domain-containing protein [Berryella intestinalis]AJC11755.1 hypothetical protein JI75_02810 [Berryella intestinalis]